MQSSPTTLASLIRRLGVAALLLVMTVLAVREWPGGGGEAPAGAQEATPGTATPTATLADPASLYRVRGGLRIERFVANVPFPVSLVRAPEPHDSPDDPFLYVTELYDGVGVISWDGTLSTYVDGLLNYDPGGPFPVQGEGGVDGITVEPGTNNLVVTYVYVDPADGVLKNRAIHFESSPDGKTAVGSQVIIDGIPSGQSHQIHGVTYGPEDGKLYINVGDSYINEPAQIDDDLRGKVLRLNPDGSIPADNPTPGSPVFAKGVRDPYGMAWHPDRDELYITDNGPTYGDRLAIIHGGWNYGWCCDMTKNALYVFSRSQVVSPTTIVFDTEHILSPPGETHLFLAVPGPVYGPAYQFNGKKLLDIKLDDDGEVAEISEVFQYIARGRSSVLGLAFGPDGLYFTDLYGEAGFASDPVLGNVYRISVDPTSPTWTPTPSPTSPPTDTPAPTRTPTTTSSPPRTATPRPQRPGDVSCDGPVDSVDAALIVQFSAARITGLPCPAAGDVNHDLITNGLDARLVLLYHSGRLPALPAG